MICGLGVAATVSISAKAVIITITIAIDRRPYTTMATASVNHIHSSNDTSSKTIVNKSTASNALWWL